MNVADTLVEFGGEVKALAEEPGRLKIGGYCVLFGDESTADLSRARDYFTKSTDFALDVAQKGRVRWHHGLDPKVGRDVWGVVDIKAEPDDVGVWVEGWIKQETAYQKKAGEWIKARKVGFSTGVPAHCVGRKSVGEANEITEWPLGADITLTLTPADPRQVGHVQSLKSVLGDDPDAATGAPPEPPEPAGFVESLKRAESALEWASQQPDLNGKKADAIKSLAESVRRFDDARPRPEPDPVPPDDSDLYAQFLAIESRLNGAAVAR